jgi:probable blue pigment (indigoidine) exporter
MFGLAYLAIISTTVAYSLRFYCITAAGASAASPFLLMSPLVAFSIEALIRGLVPTPQQAIGAAIVLTSLFVGQFRARR